MLRKWTVLLFLYVLLKNSKGNFPFTETDIQFANENMVNFKTKFHQKLDEWDVHYPLYKLRQSSDLELNSCMGLLEDRLANSQQKIERISSRLKNVWMSFNTEIIPSLKINGEVFARYQTNIDRLDFQFSAFSTKVLNETTEKIKNRVILMQEDLEKTIFKSQPQSFKSNIILKNVTVVASEIGKINNYATINGLSTRRLRSVLRKKGSQMLHNKIVIANLSCAKSTVEYLNMRKIEDCVLLSPVSLSLTGNYTFQTISAGKVFVKNKINGENVENFVLKFKEQDIDGLKLFKRLSANNIRTRFVDEISIDDLKKVNKGSTIFPSALNFSSDLIIEGNLNVSSLNRKAIGELFTKTVKTNQEQDIFGRKTFKSMYINGSVVLIGAINNQFLDRLMTTNTDQLIYADVSFLNNSTFQTILTDSLNGIDLNRQAAIKSRSNVIYGIKTFTKNLEVSTISMKEGVHLNSFDPSAERSRIIRKDGANAFDMFWFDSVTVENINATEVEVDTNYFPDWKNIHNVWLRTTNQNISYLKTENMHVKNMMEVSKLNNIRIEDLVTVKEDVTVEGAVDFVEVFTETLKLGGEKMNVNFSPKYWNMENVKISNNITIGNAVLERNLIIDGSLKNFEQGMMRRKDRQEVNGPVKFEEVNVKNLSLKDIKVEIINNDNFTDFLDHAVVGPIGNKSIHNKYFEALKGSDLACNGVLNDVSLEKVVLRNLNQNITSTWIFTNAQSFENIRVKNFFDGIQLKDIIYTDKHEVISNKQFDGTIKTNYINSSGHINGVNVSRLQQEAFNKSKENSLKEKLTFFNNINASEIYVGKKIDNIDLKDVILLDASNEFKSLSAPNLIAQNMTVKGQINRCDLNSVVNNAFRHRDFKNVTARTTSKSLVIEGNLRINYLMKNKFPDWISSLKNASSPEIEENLKFENLNADNIVFSQTLNYIPLGFVMDDAVRRTIENQPIPSRKYFREINAIRSLIEKLNSYSIDGMNITEMFEFYVNKTSNQTYTLLCTSLKDLVARQTIVKGYLNGLKLPTDVVLSNISEIIKSKVFINNTVHASQGLLLYGRINGIKLEDFIARRVTRSTAQEIFCTINFNEDVTLRGNTELNGTINNLRLENVLRKLPNKSVNGNKTFNGSLEILANISVRDPICGVHLDRVLRSSRNETVKEMQFSRLNVNNMVCETINGIHFTAFYDYVHGLCHEVKYKLDKLTSNITSIQDSLRIKKDALEHPFSFFGYFVLHEIIKSGPIVKFLPVYEYETFGGKYETNEGQVTQMVMWVSKMVNGCSKIRSLIADVSMDGTFNVTKKLAGRVFPFSLHSEREDIIGFYVREEDSRKCSSEIKSLIIKAIAFDWMNDSKISMPEGASLVDVQLLELREIYLLVALNTKDPFERILIYQYDALNNSWSEHQQFHSLTLRSVHFVLVQREDASFNDPHEAYLSVTGDRKNSGVTIYGWDSENEEFYFKTNLSTTASTHSLWLYAHRNLYLILSKEMVEVKRNHTKVPVFTEPLEIYTLDEDELILNHIVKINGIRFIQSFILEGEVFILATSSHMETVYILQLRGFNGFEVIQKIPAAGVTEARVFSVNNSLYLALNSKTTQSRILKASIHGG